MSSAAQIDYDALAKQAGAIDYDALAKEAGEVDSSPPKKADESWYNRYARKFLGAAGLPESISDIPNWARKMTGQTKGESFKLGSTKDIGAPVVDPIKKAIKEPTQENIVGAVPFIGPGSVQAAQDVRSGDYGGAIADIAGTVSPALAAPGIPGKITDAGENLGRSVKNSPGTIGNVLRNEKGKVRPGIKTVSGLAGGFLGHQLGMPGGELAGYMAGRSLSDLLIPERSGGPPGWSVKIPSRMPKATLADVIKPGPFAGMTPTNVPIGTATLADSLRASPETVAPRVQMVDKFSKAEPSRIHSPDSPAPPKAKGSYWSFEKVDLLKAVMSGDKDAITVWQNRFGNLPDNVRYLVENPGTRGLYRSEKR